MTTFEKKRAAVLGRVISLFKVVRSQSELFSQVRTSMSLRLDVFLREDGFPAGRKQLQA